LQISPLIVNGLLLSQIFRISDNVSRTANNAFAGRMRLAGREFETPGIAPNRQRSSEVLTAKQHRVLSFFANVPMESDEVRSSNGNLFHVAGPDTTKLWRPMVVLVPGTTSVRCSPQLPPANDGREAVFELHGSQSMPGPLTYFHYPIGPMLLQKTSVQRASTLVFL